jgi:hypothetical protein
MSGVMLSGPSFRPKYIELDGGIITHSAVTDASGRYDILYAKKGHFRFFVTLVEEDGARLGLWDGVSVGTAIREALSARREFGIEAPVQDVFGGRDFGGAE